jgi:excisionase family DNA binding protein
VKPTYCLAEVQKHDVQHLVITTISEDMTMIDIASEKLLTLDQAAEKLLVSKATIHGWIRTGSKGIRLEAIKLGVHWRTSDEALQRFGNRLTPNQDPVPAFTPSTQMSKQRQRELEQVAERLDKMLGVKKCETCRKVLVTTNMIIPKNERLWCAECLVKRPSATLGQRIRMFRWLAMLSLNTLSERTGISVENIRAYESNQKIPSEIHLAKLIEVFGDELVSNLAT